ncbi:kinetochore protein NDC80 [Enteropsectra breve]|nr:kinetochore protein NDC80 [Enteropsectra breve]
MPMKRFTLTPETNRYSRIPTTNIAVSSQPRMSICADDIKSGRNVREKAYKSSCAENIVDFLQKNNYEGTATVKMLLNPSNKEFQLIFKFVYSFIDSTLFTKFEDDVINILKMIKYPYASEITRSHLTAITPHTWPVLLSMVSWMVDIVKSTDFESTDAHTVESKFYDFVCKGYLQFMEGIEDVNVLEQVFLEDINLMHNNERAEITQATDKIKAMEEQRSSISSHFCDIEQLHANKRKINEDLNILIQQEKQLKIKQDKYMSAIEKCSDDIANIEKEIGQLSDEKNDLNYQINSQTINPEDIKDMNIEKLELYKALEKLKPERENATKGLRENENILNALLDDLEGMASELSRKTNADVDTKKICESLEFDYALVSSFEDELVGKKESMVNLEININVLNDRLEDKKAAFTGYEEQYAHFNAKLQTIGAIYVEKKEIFDRSHQKNRNEMDKLDNDLLKLKLESDSVFLKSEKEYSESKIRLDIMLSDIARDKEEISKSIWELHNSASVVMQALDMLSKRLAKNSK